MLKWVRIDRVDVVKIGSVHAKVPSQNTLYSTRGSASDALSTILAYGLLRKLIYLSSAIMASRRIVSTDNNLLDKDDRNITLSVSEKSNITPAVPAWVVLLLLNDSITSTMCG